MQQKRHCSRLYLTWFNCITILTIVFILILSENISAQWGQWGGPNRNFSINTPVKLKTDWAEDGPERIWSNLLGDGNSAISVDNGWLYTMFRRGTDEVVVAFDASTGEKQWEFVQAASLWPDFRDGYGSGPHSTPLIVGDYLFTVGIRANLLCLNKKNGEKVWDHDLWVEYNAKPPGRGYASSVIAYKNLIILPVGGSGYGVMAFDIYNGTVLWKSGDFIVAYSSPIIINVDGQDQVVVFAKDYVVGMEPNTGELLWKYPHRTSYRVNASTPVWGDDNLLFLSSAYDTGSRVLHISRINEKSTVKEIWYNRKMQIHHGTAIRTGDMIYGSSGDFGPAFLTGIHAKTGEITIQQRGFAKSNFVYNGDQLILLDEDGILAIAAIKPDRFEIKAKSQILFTRSWTVPTLVGTTLYVRDRQEIIALDLKP